MFSGARRTPQNVLSLGAHPSECKGKSLRDRPASASSAGPPHARAAKRCRPRRRAVGGGGSGALSGLPGARAGRGAARSGVRQPRRAPGDRSAGATARRLGRKKHVSACETGLSGARTHAFRRSPGLVCRGLSDRRAAYRPARLPDATGSPVWVVHGRRTSPTHGTPHARRRAGAAVADDFGPEAGPAAGRAAGRGPWPRIAMSGWPVLRASRPGRRRVRRPVRRLRAGACRDVRRIVRRPGGRRAWPSGCRRSSC